MNYYTLAAGAFLITGVVLLFLAYSIFKENTAGRLNRVTSLMLFFGGLGPVLGAFGIIISSAGQIQLEKNWLVAIFYLWELFFPLLLLFALVFPEEARPIIRYPKLKYLIFIPHLFHIIWVLLFSSPEKIFTLGDPQKMNSLVRLFVEPVNYILHTFSTFLRILFKFHLKFFSVINLTCIVLALVSLDRGCRKANSQRIKKQVRIIIWGIGFSMSIYALAYILPVLLSLKWSELARYSMTVGALLVGSFSISWAVIKHKFLDVQVLARQSLVYTIGLAILLGTYFVFLSEIKDWLLNLVGIEIPYLEIAFIIVALLFFRPLLSFLDNQVQKLFLRDRSDYRNVMEDFSSRVISILDFEELKKTVFETLKNQMYLENVVLGVIEPKTSKVHFYSDKQNSSGSELFLSLEDPIWDFLSQKKKTVYVEEVEQKVKNSKIKDILKAEKVFLLVPLFGPQKMRGFLGLGKKQSGFKFVSEEFKLLSVLANQIQIAMENAFLYREALEKQKLEEELALARQIQLALLPKSLPQSRFFEVVTHIQTAQQVGGDYYDFWQNSDKSMGLAIADATGKGVPAALLISLVHASLRAEVKNNLSPCRTISNINQLVFSSTSSEKFASLFYGEFFFDTKKLVYSNAGHNYPVIVHTDGKTTLLDKGGTLLGAFADAAYESGEILLQSQDLLLFYTDGLTDAQDEREEPFGEERLLELLCRNHRSSVHNLKDLIVNEVTRYTGANPLFDDLTFILLRMV